MIRLVWVAFITFVLFFFSGIMPFPGILRPISSIQTSDRVVALTFDDGPSALTPELLEILKKNKIKATFFVTGEHALQSPDLIKKIHDEGHEIENHSYSHPHLLFHGYFFIRTQLMKTQEVIRLLTGETPRFFRPPYGQSDILVLEAASKEKLKPALVGDRLRLEKYCR